MTVLFLTIPTAGDRAHLLTPLIEDSGVPRDRVIVVATRPGVEVPPGVTVVQDLGSPNIQRWWNLGIDEAVGRGATVVAVSNDDVRISPATVPGLADALRSTGAAIASPARPEFPLGLHRGNLVPYAPRLWGSLWALRVDSGLRPDSRYVWWYGDNDLDIRARRDHGGVVLVDVPFEHMHPSVGTSQNPLLAAQTDRDAQTFEHQYARLLRRSRRRARWRSRFTR